MAVDKVLLEKLLDMENSAPERGAPVPKGNYMVTLSREYSEIKIINGAPMLKLTGVITTGEAVGRRISAAGFWFASEKARTGKSFDERQKQTREITGAMLRDLMWACVGSPSGGSSIVEGMHAYIEGLNDDREDVTETFEGILELLDDVEIPIVVIHRANGKQTYSDMRTVYCKEDPASTYETFAALTGAPVEITL
jgi:hypothetical protein